MPSNRFYFLFYFLPGRIVIIGHWALNTGYKLNNSWFTTGRNKCDQKCSVSHTCEKDQAASRGNWSRFNGKIATIGEKCKNICTRTLHVISPGKRKTICSNVGGYPDRTTWTNRPDRRRSEEDNKNGRRHRPRGHHHLINIRTFQKLARMTSWAGWQRAKS